MRMRIVYLLIGLYIVGFTTMLALDLIVLFHPVAMVSFLVPFFLLPIMIIAAVVHIIRKRRKFKFSCAIPLIIALFTFAFIFFAPKAFNDIQLARELPKREEVVGLIERGELVPDANNYAQLPTDLEFLSTTGEVFVERKKKGLVVVFFTNKLVIDGKHGIAYVSDPESQFFTRRRIETKKIAENWYMVDYFVAL